LRWYITSTWLTIPLGERCRLPPPVGVLWLARSEGGSTGCPEKL
jgi:hypothetical protein